MLPPKCNGGKSVKIRFIFLVAVAYFQAISCTVNDSKEDPPVNGKEEGTNFVDPSATALNAILKIEDLGIYKSEALTLEWDSPDGAKCSIIANGMEIANDLSSSGAIEHYPDIDTQYELVCQKGDASGKSAQSISLLVEENVAIHLFEKEDIGSILSFGALSSLSCDEGKPCFFADIETDLFSKTPRGWEETENFENVIEASQQAFPSSKIVGLDQFAANFDEGNSIVFGFRDSLPTLKLQEKCQEALPYSVGSPIDSNMTLSNSIASGFEELSNGLLNVSVFTDLSLTGFARRSIIPKGSDITATFRSSEVTGKVSASFKDYSGVAGRFIVEQNAANRKISSSGTGFSSVESSWEGASDPGGAYRDSSAYYPPVPRGYILPARGYGGDQNAFQPKDQVCNFSRQSVLEIFTETWYGPVSEYFPRMASKRIVQGPGSIQCNEIDRGYAQHYGLGADWKVELPDAWWFVTDTNWPNCGGYDCLGKSQIFGYDGRFDDVEPVFNHCISRFAGLGDAISRYTMSAFTACRDSPLFKAAVAAEQTSINDSLFKQKCGQMPSCLQTVTALQALAQWGSLQPSKTLVDQSLEEMKASKAAGRSFVLGSHPFTAGSIKVLDRSIYGFTESLREIENLRLSFNPPARWTALWYEPGSAPLKMEEKAEFSSYEAILATVQEYAELSKKLKELQAASVSSLGCSFTAAGRFRRYEAISVSEVEITPLTKMVRKVPILRDLRTEDF